MRVGEVRTRTSSSQIVRVRCPVGDMQAHGTLTQAYPLAHACSPDILAQNALTLHRADGEAGRPVEAGVRPSALLLLHWSTGVAS